MGIDCGQDIEALLALRQRVVGWLPGETFHGTLWRAGLPKTMGAESASKARASTTGTQAEMDSAV
jgi:hydroxymethylglutaryl-CoA lyase